jgi:hypothetical protein
MEGLDFFPEAKGTPAGPPDARGRLVQQLRQQGGKEPEHIPASTVLRGMDELPVALSGRDSWGVGTDLATEAEARAFGAKVRASLIPRSKITAATPMLHDRPLVVSYKGGSVTIPPPGIDLRHANRTFFEHAGKGYRDWNHFLNAQTHVESVDGVHRFKGVGRVPDHQYHYVVSPEGQVGTFTDEAGAVKRVRELTGQQSPDPLDNMSTAPAEALAAHFKSLGQERTYAWGQFVKARGLKPEIDAKQFYTLFDRA